MTLDDNIPPEVMIGEVPGWAFDMFTREGRAALSRFLRCRTKAAGWISANIPPNARLDLLSNLVFYLEGGISKQRLRWPVGDELRRRAEIECLGEGCPDATEILGLRTGVLESMNKIRRQSIGESSHAR